MKSKISSNTRRVGIAIVAVLGLFVLLYFVNDSFVGKAGQLPGDGKLKIEQLDTSANKEIVSPRGRIESLIASQRIRSVVQQELVSYTSLCKEQFYQKTDYLYTPQIVNVFCECVAAVASEQINFNLAVSSSKDVVAVNKKYLSSILTGAGKECVQILEKSTDLWPFVGYGDTQQEFCLEQKGGSFCGQSKSGLHEIVACGPITGKPTDPGAITLCKEGEVCNYKSTTTIGGKNVAQCATLDSACLSLYGVDSKTSLCLDGKSISSCLKGKLSLGKECSNGCMYGLSGCN